MKKVLTSSKWLMVLCLGFMACGSYKQNIMFRVPEGQALQQRAQETQRNYVIQKNDYLKLHVYTNNGELIIDPELKLFKDMTSQAAGSLKPNPDYLVDVNGVVKFPMVGELKLESLAIRQAEEILQKEYSKYYKDAFVKLEFINKRVVVLAPAGGKVIPLVNEGISLVEALALANAIDHNSKVHNIRVLRGDQWFVADLSTIEGYKQANMIMQTGDIVYVEPVRRPVSEALRDYGPIVSVISSLTTLIVVIVGLN